MKILKFRFAGLIFCGIIARKLVVIEHVKINIAQIGWMDLECLKEFSA